jgi:UDPglucose 6-dehydrogenase
VSAYDPKGAEKAVEWGLIDPAKVKLVSNPLDAVQDAEALLLATEWEEFINVDLSEARTRMHTPLVFDGRNLFNPETMRDLGFIYHAVGRPDLK